MLCRHVDRVLQPADCLRHHSKETSNGRCDLPAALPPVGRATAVRVTRTLRV